MGDFLQELYWIRLKPLPLLYWDRMSVRNFFIRSQCSFSATVKPLYTTTYIWSNAEIYVYVALTQNFRDEFLKLLRGLYSRWGYMRLAYISCIYVYIYIYCVCACVRCRVDEYKMISLHSTHLKLSLGYNIV